MSEVLAFSPYVDTYAEQPALELCQNGHYVEAFYGESEPELLSEILPVREDFVVKVMHWYEEGHKEGDRYDIHPGTLHLAMREGESADTRILSSLRITPATSVESSLSGDMLLTNPDLYNQLSKIQINALNQTGERGNLMDLTRLVSNIEKDVDVNAVLGSFMELFGTAAGIIRNERRGDDAAIRDVKWIFMTTQTIRDVLAGQGVEVVDLAHGYVSEKDRSRGWTSYFCMVDQESAIESIFRRGDQLPQSYPHLSNGLQRANAL